ncbi:hypothetical protein LOK49_LG10G02078 [Camellia lanceoleosa]|uniref:Uncharacterized protein n=1 Tax=Camellia lanceoleosa TaxID=1840588 RepID=A0ACC0GCC9_9ERIC|nr:hypothetical protein LOK49_LG10G02078 [Camellia lanceoleosa]
MLRAGVLLTRNKTFTHGHCSSVIQVIRCITSFQCFLEAILVVIPRLAHYCQSLALREFMVGQSVPSL